MERSAKNVSALNKEEMKQFLNSFDTVLTDCDGVLWLYDAIIPGSPEALSSFRKMGKKLFYITNNSTKTRDEFLVKCTKMGYQATKEEILSTAYLTACYLKSLNFKKKAYIVGSKGLTQEFDLVGIRHTEVGPDPLTTDLATLVHKNLRLDPEVGAVVVGFDEHFSYPKMMKAASYLNKEGCLFVATNTDERFPMDSADCIIPGTGSIVSAVETCAGRPAFKIGKPSVYIRDVIMNKYKVDPGRTLMIGDRCNTDILLGVRCGFQTLLVLSGVTKLHEVEQWQKSSKKGEQELVPNYYLQTLGDLCNMLS